MSHADHQRHSDHGRQSDHGRHCDHEGHADHGGHAGHGGHGPLLAELLDLDAAVHSDYLAQAMTKVRAGTAGHRVARILDVGAGVGTGTVLLAQEFTGAEVVALDIDEAMLAHVRARADAAGVGARVTTTCSDVTSPLDTLGEFDLVWSATALHEVADPGRALANLSAVLRPGGLLFVVEMEAAPWVLPASLSDLESRIRAVTGDRSADHPDWSPIIAQHGFDLVEVGTIDTDLTGPGSGLVGEYAQLDLRRVAQHAISAVDAADREAMTWLMGDGPDSVRHRDDLWIRGRRSIWSARRQASTSTSTSRENQNSFGR